MALHRRTVPSADEVELSPLSRALRLIRVNCRPNGKARYTRRFDSGLQIPQEAAFRSGGKQGLHSEHLGPLLAEMQYLQRSHPGLQW